VLPGSIKEKLLIPGRKAPERNRGGKAAERSLNFLFLLVYSTHKKPYSRVDGNVCSTQEQGASSQSFETVLSVLC